MQFSELLIFLPLSLKKLVRTWIVFTSFKLGFYISISTPLAQRHERQGMASSDVAAPPLTAPAFPVPVLNLDCCGSFLEPPLKHRVSPPRRALHRAVPVTVPNTFNLSSSRGSAADHSRRGLRGFGKRSGL